VQVRKFRQYIEFGFFPNDLQRRTESGKHYFIKQYLKPGVFVGGAGLEVVPETEGKAAIATPRVGFAAKTYGQFPEQRRSAKPVW
jgi:hypothetical protein